MGNDFHIQKNFIGRAVASWGISSGYLFHHFKYGTESLSCPWTSCMKSKGLSLFRFHENRAPGTDAMDSIYIGCTNICRFFRQFGSLTDPGGTFKVYGK
jgi:hypothetical protein